MKKALITGITGQDGAYLAELLLHKGYEVHGIKRRSSLLNTDRIDHLYQDPHEQNQHFFLHYGDMTDTANLIKLIADIKPDEVYNLAAQSHVKVSFDMPDYTANVDALGTLRLLEAIRINRMEHTIKFYQASTSELYGGMHYNMPTTGYTEASPFHPRSPYGVAKLYGFRIIKNYRESYNMYACNGILFNHESPRRGETFVTRKITRAVAKISLGLQDKLYLGNLDAERDRGHAKDYVQAMRLMLQQDTPEDFIIASGEKHSVREFVNYAFEQGNIHISWQGTGIQEKGYDQYGNCLVEIDPAYFRPAEVDCLLGDATQAKTKLGWTSQYSFEQLVKEMVAEDLQVFAKAKLLKQHGYNILDQHE